MIYLTHFRSYGRLYFFTIIRFEAYAIAAAMYFVSLANIDQLQYVLIVFCLLTSSDQAH